MSAKSFSKMRLRELVQHLKHGDNFSRESAAEELGYDKKSVGAVPALIQAMKDSSSNVKFFAAWALGEAEGHALSAVPALAGAAKDNDGGVRKNAIQALGKIGETKRTVPVLAEALKDPEEEVRWHAAEAIWKLGDNAADAVPNLITLLREKRPQESMERIVRLKIIEALEKMGERAALALPELTEALVDDDPRVRKKAVQVIKKIKSSPEVVVPALIEKARDFCDTDVSVNALVALGHLGAAAFSAIPTLVELLKCREHTIHRHAGLALANMGEQALKAVLEAAREKRVTQTHAQNTIREIHARMQHREITRGVRKMPERPVERKIARRVA